MAECCIVGCSNKATKRGELKFYTLPTSKSSRPNKVKRRQLWLEAIEKVNGDTAGLKEDAQICSAHFISGQMSLDVSNQDFVPSVFPKPREKTRRETLRPRSGVLAEAPKVTPKRKAERKLAESPEETPQFNSAVFPDVSYCEPLEDEELLEEEKKEETTKLHTDQVTTQPPSELPPEYPQLKKPKLELKSIVSRLGLFRCEVCNGKFSSGSMLVKHKQLHDQEWSDDENWPTESEKSDFTDIPVPVEEPSFKCNMCDRSFPTIHNLKRHKLLHVRDARKCKLCGTMFCKRHNHVVAQPQISTDTNLDDYTAKEDKMNVCTENQIPDTSSYSDIVDEGLSLLLNSDSLTLDAIAAAQEQPAQDIEQKPAPTITFSPRKPGLLTAFKSFLTKHKVANIKTEQLEATTSSGYSTQNVESPQVTVVNNDTNVTSATITATTPITTTQATATTTVDTTATQPGLANKPVPLITSTKSLTPQAGKPLFLISKPPQPVQPPQNMEQSTVCLSFSKPMPPNVIQEFMSFISKNECSKSTGPRLITFTSKPEEVAPKQDTPANEISSIIKLEPSAVPIGAPQLSREATALPKEEKTTFIITTQPKLFHKILPSPQKVPLFVSPQKAPLSSSSIISPVQSKPQPKAKQTRKNKPFPIELLAPQKRYVHGSSPPTPEPIMAKIQRGPWDSPFPNYPKDFVQPHLPQTPALPPSLQMFSPQFLTSAFLDVKRDFDYILGK